jgi:hypothetical protein
MPAGGSRSGGGPKLGPRFFAAFIERLGLIGAESSFEYDALWVKNPEQGLCLLSAIAGGSRLAPWRVEPAASAA